MRECMNCMRCMRCMEPGDPGKTGTCPYMSSLPGYEERFPNVLPLETILYDRYVVGRALSVTDYSVIYLCWDALLERRIVIREFFPGCCCARGQDQKSTVIRDGADPAAFQAGKKAFMEEAALLSLHQDIEEMIHIYRVFEENNTAYYLMEYLEGSTLLDYFEESGHLSPVTARELFLDLAWIVDRLHRLDICHLNLAPENVYLDADRRMKLIDFGRARLAMMHADRKNCPVLVEKSCAAPEILQGGEPTKRADMYSLGAIYLQMLCGREAGEHQKALKRKLKKEDPKSTTVNILQMLLVTRPERRPDNIGQLLTFTGGDPKRRKENDETRK